MQKLREWGFPVALVVTWMVTAAYTVSLMIETPRRAAPEQQSPPEAVASLEP